MGIDWTTILLSAVSGLLSAGGVGGLFYLREDKRAKQLQNESTASSQWRELYERCETRCESLNTKVDALYKENGCLRDQNNSLTTQRAVLTMYKCEALACTDRRPPFGSQINNLKQ